jgi:hypothetical protein
MMRLACLALLAVVVAFAGCTCAVFNEPVPQFAGPGEVEYNCACGLYTIVDEKESAPTCCGKPMKPNRR